MRILRTARLLLGIPVHALAAEAKLSVRELHRLERGETRAQPATLARLDEAFWRLLLARELEARDVA